MLTDSSWVERARRAGRPLIFAHRGGAGLAPENTLTAFARAHALGVDGFELDVRLTRDGEVVVIHDDTVDRTTDGTGRVSAMTLDALGRLDAGYRCQPGSGTPDAAAFGGNAAAVGNAASVGNAAASDNTAVSGDTAAVGNGAASGNAARGSASGEFPFRAAGVQVPLLRDVLRQFPDTLLVIELKGHDPALALRAFEIVRAAGAVGRVCFGGFHRATLRRVRQLGGPDARVCSSACREETRWALYRSWLHVRWPWTAYDAFQVPETSGRTRVVSPRFVRAAHAEGKLVQVWTVNEKPDMRRLLDWGVDGLITDRPDVALRVRDAFAANTTGVA